MPYVARPPHFDPLIGQAEAEAVVGEYTDLRWQRVACLRQGARTVGNGENTGTARKMFLRYADQDLLLKQIPWYCDRPTHARAVARLQQRLADQGGPAAPLVPTRAGELVCSLRIAGEPRLYTLQRLVPGTIWSGSVGECIEAGRALAVVHSATPDLLPGATAEQISRYDVFGIARAAMALASTELVKQGSDRDLVGATAGILRHFAGVVDELGKAAQTRGYSDCVRVIHGDVNPTNTIFGIQRVVAALVDFDNCCRDHPAHDVARGLVHFGCFPSVPAVNRFAGLPSRLRDDLGAGFLIGYRQNAPDWEDVAAVLPEVAGCIAIELGVLALLNGWFGAGEIPPMVDLPQRVVDWVRDLVPRSSKSE